jgi:hypothetical protein
MLLYRLIATIFFLVELISISFEIELLTTFVCRENFFMQKNAFFDDDDDNIFDF